MQEFKRTLSPYFLLLILTMITACSVDQDDDFFQDTIISDEPIFYFSTMDSEYRIEAGKNDFYMFTEYEVDDMNVYSFIARFAKLSTCSFECDEELIIKIRNSESTNLPDIVQINSAVSTGEYTFAGTQELDFSEVVIEYTNSEGVIYSSTLTDRNEDRAFQILSVSDFNLNENGQLTKKLEVAFTCDLVNLDEDMIHFVNASAVIGIAYPN